jgi:methylenetetrahydrofolate reductase (NADPH)
MTRIPDLLAAGRTLSFEFFPPKTEAGVAELDAALQELAALHPSFISVTYGALGSTRANTRDLVIGFDQRHPFPAMPHLTCVGQSRSELHDLLEVYRASGIENVLALAGDPPADGSPPEGDFTYATELVDLVREVGGFAIGVAAFPELHPRSTDRATDRRHLADKLCAADFGISQFFFETEHYIRLIDELDALGCSTPLIAGVMPFVSVPGVRRMAAINGTHIPDALQARLDEVDGDPEAVRALGVEVATELCAELLDHGVPGLHLYALNRAGSIKAIHAQLDLSAG